MGEPRARRLGIVVAAVAAVLVVAPAQGYAQLPPLPPIPSLLPTLHPSPRLSGSGRMPVAGLAYWYGDWHAYRCCPTPHLHQGLDIFAPRDAPALAVADGTIYEISIGNSAGKSTYLRDDDGTNYYHFHLNRWPKGLKIGQRVKRGQLIGYVGNTGNAIHTATHIHFEIHPFGGPAVPPKPFLDRWVKEAVREARLMIGRFSDQLSVADRVDFRMRRSFDLMGEGGTMEASSPAWRSAWPPCPMTSGA